MKKWEEVAVMSGEKLEVGGWFSYLLFFLDALSSGEVGMKKKKLWTEGFGGGG